jgi:hypothetical protein
MVDYWTTGNNDITINYRNHAPQSYGKWDSPTTHSDWRNSRPVSYIDIR